MDIISIFHDFCIENDLSIKLSHDMPSGYETAYGTYDVTVNTLFLNMELLKGASEYEVLFFLFHELRHAVQYHHPGLFDREIQESRFYVILYNGICYKLIENAWIECVLEGSEDYFTHVYSSLPYELDANTFAYEKTKELCGDSEALRNLYGFWIPEDKLEYDELRKTFDCIDDKIINS